MGDDAPGQLHHLLIIIGPSIAIVTIIRGEGFDDGSQASKAVNTFGRKTPYSTAYTRVYVDMVIDSNCQLFYPYNNEYCDQRIFVVTGLMYVNRCRLDI